MKRMSLLLISLVLSAPVGAQFTPKNVCTSASNMSHGQIKALTNTGLKHGVCLAVDQSNKALFSGDNRKRERCQEATFVLLQEYTERTKASAELTIHQCSR